MPPHKKSKTDIFTGRVTSCLQSFFDLRPPFCSVGTVCHYDVETEENGRGKGWRSDESLPVTTVMCIRR